MNNLFNLALALGIALFVGLGGTWYALTTNSGVETIESGEWRLAVEIPSTNVNPYARASVARSGNTPMLASELLSLRATTDTRGVPLTGNCLYQLKGKRIDARVWTLTLAPAGNTAAAAGAAAQALTSYSLIGAQNGDFTISISPRVQPGNWLSNKGMERAVLILNIYDSQLYTRGRFDEVRLPEIIPVRCL